MGVSLPATDVCPVQERAGRELAPSPECMSPSLGPSLAWKSGLPVGLGETWCPGLAACPAAASMASGAVVLLASRVAFPCFLELQPLRKSETLGGTLPLCCAFTQRSIRADSQFQHCSWLESALSLAASSEKVQGPGAVAASGQVSLVTASCHGPGSGTLPPLPCILLSRQLRLVPKTVASRSQGMSLLSWLFIGWRNHCSAASLPPHLHSLKVDGSTVGGDREGRGQAAPGTSPGCLL